MQVTQVLMVARKEIWMLVGGRTRDFPDYTAELGEMGGSGVEGGLVRRIIVITKSPKSSFSTEVV